MKNKLYFTKKTRAVFYTLTLLFCGLLSNGLQAQGYSHVWVGGTTGDWNLATNWNTFILNNFNVSGATNTTSTLVSITAPSPSIAIGDVIVGGNLPANIVYTVTGVSIPTRTVTFTPVAGAVPTNAVYAFTRPTTASVPGSATGHNVQINDGECSLTANPTNDIRVLTVGNTGSAQGKLNIGAGIKLTLSNLGTTATNTVIAMRGGIINNSGTIKATCTSDNGSPIVFETPANTQSTDWGIIGAGVFELINGSTGTPKNNGFLAFTNTGLSIAPRVIVNSGSTISLGGATVDPANPYSIFYLTNNTKGKIEGAGFTTSSSFKPALFTSSTGSILDIAASVTLANEIIYTRTSTDISGTINNAGTITNRALLKVSGTGALNNNTLTGSIINKANTSATSVFVFTAPIAGTFGALAVGDTYTLGGVTYTIAVARAGTANSTVLIVATAPTGSVPPATSGSGATPLTKGTSAAGSATMDYTAVSYNIYGGYISANAGTISNVTQERYLSSNQRGWRLLSNPLSDISYGDVSTLSATPLTLGNGTAKTYDSATNDWIISNIDDTQLWPSRTPISLFVRGQTAEVTVLTYSNPSNPARVTLSVKGTANYATTTATTASSTPGKFYLVTNPFPAPVSVVRILAASSGLKTTISYYNPTKGSNGTTDLIVKKGGYDYPIVTGTAGSASDVIIPPMGAFFVQANDGIAATINVPATAIYTFPALQTGTYTHRLAKSAEVSKSLKLEVTADNTYYDTVAIQFKEVGTLGNNIDFGKMPNSVLDAYTIEGSNKMAVSELELKGQTIPLGITSTIQKNYAFKVAENTLPAGYEAVLVDTVLNTNTVLVPNATYNFAIDSTPASQGDTRFAINLKTSGPLAVAKNEMDTKIKLWPNPARGQVNITNDQNQKEGASSIEISSINGQLIYSQKSNPGTTTTIQTKGWSKGVYILKAINNGTQTTKKLIIK